MNEETKPQDLATLLIGRIERLGNGELAQLRRAAGDRLDDRRDTLWFPGIVRGAAHEETAFLVATLLAQYSTQAIRSREHRGKGDFGATWKRAIGSSPSPSIERRFTILLGSEFDRDGRGDLPYRLRQMVRYAAAKGVGLDWSQLLKDLGGWNHIERYVQKSWARSFFTSFHDPSDNVSE